MRFSYREPGGSWANLAPEQVDPGPTNEVNRATTLVITIPAEFYAQIETWDEDFLYQSKKFVEICVTPDSKDYSNLNSSFDSVDKLWWGRVVKIEHIPFYVRWHCEEIHALLLREPLLFQANVMDDAFTKADHGLVKDVYKKSSTASGYADELEVEETDSSSVSWTNDEYNQHGVRIVARAGEQVTVYPSSIAASGATLDSSDLSTSKVDERDNSDYAYGSTRNKSNTANADFYLELTFPVPPSPDNEYDFELFLGWGNHSSVSLNNWFSGGIPLYIYNVEDGTWDEMFKTASLPLIYNAYPTYESRGEFRIKLKDPGYKFYDYDNRCIKIRIYSGWVQYLNDCLYDADIYIWYAALTYTDAYPHDPVEFLISDTKSGDVLQLSVIDDSFDLQTKRINVGDEIYVIANDEHYLETIIPDFFTDYSIEDRLNQILAPTSQIVRYTTFNYKQVGLDFQDLCEQNGWYWEKLRNTSSGKYTLQFRERSDPPGAGTTGIVVYHEMLAGDAQPSQIIDLLTATRGIIIKGRDGATGAYGHSSLGGYTTLPLLFDPRALPVHVLNRSDVPEALLDDFAEKFFEMRESIDKIIENVKLNYVAVFNERHLTFTVDTDISSSGQYSTVSSSALCSFYCRDRAGRRCAEFVDGDSGHDYWVRYTFTSTSPATPDSSHRYIVLAWVRISAKGNELSNHKFQLLLLSGTTICVQVLFSFDNVVRYYTGSSEISTGLTWEDGAWHLVEIATWTSSTFKIRLDRRGEWADLPEYNNRSTWGAISSVDFYSATSTTVTAQVSDLGASWLQGGTYTPEEAPDEVFRAGLSAKVALFPTSRGNPQNYRYSDNKAIITKIRWNQDYTADISLGLNPRDENADFLRVISHLLHDSTKT